MELSHLEVIFEGLNASGVRYVLVGGLAVIAHGYVRYTNDIDLVMALDQVNLTKGMEVLGRLGYTPRVPVKLSEFADPAKRDTWSREKGMVVFQLVNERFPREPIDLFISAPFDVDEVFERCEWREVTPNLKAPVIDLERLLAMKRAANRPRDLIDVEHLLKLQQYRGDE